MNRLDGVVKWFNNDKGYGFIEADSINYFVHFKEIQIKGYKALKEAQKVTFIPAKGERGWAAKEVVIVKDSD